MTITLTTDFGSHDGYVGAVKGVLARLTSRPIVDIAHDLPRGDIAHAAWVIYTACQEFPPGTIHLVVVDPGVGGARQSVIVETDEHFFVGPDNGIFAYLQVRSAVAIELAALGTGRPISPTFHGRDVFAPVTGALAQGERPAAFGKTTALQGNLAWGPRAIGQGRVVHIDHYGNLITDLPEKEAGARVTILGQSLPIVRTYEDVQPGALLAYVGSMGTIEIGVRDGRADVALSALRGSVVLPI